MRYSLSNGITLCRRCHDKVKDCEDVYESFFRGLVGSDSLIRIQRMLREAERKETCPEKSPNTT
jgi:hypothetical protein